MVVASKTVTAADNWAWSFENLAKYRDQGIEIVYSITEDAQVNYTTEYDGYNVINHHTPDKTSVTVTKAWDDADDQDGIRPASVTVKLLADGEDTGKTLELNASNNWTGSFTDLDENVPEGIKIEYTIEEVEVEGYDTVISGNATEGYTITNTHEPEVININGGKIWDDANDQDGIRPDSVTIRLLANGEEIDSVTVGDDDGWAWSFTDLPKYANGEEITYTITEDAVEGYESAVNGCNVTNTHTPETVDLSGAKEWKDSDNQDGIRPGSITIRLYADGAEIAVKTVNAANDWAWTFEDLAKYRDHGVEIVYTITEDEVSGYETTYDGLNVINYHEVAKKNIEGGKTWDDNNDQDGKRPDSITINLLADGVKIASKTVSAADDWEWSFINLDVYKDGVEIVYSVTEEKVAEYTTTYNGYNVVNTHIPETVDLSGEKTWIDSNDQDGKRPDSIVIHLLANGKEVAVKTVTAADSWAWTFEDLPRYANGTEIVYTVTEDTVPYYEPTYDGLNVTNTHEIIKTEVPVEKVWDDADDQDGKRPNDITVILLANGEKVGEKVLSSGNDWADVFTDLDMYADGKMITYTVEEIGVDEEVYTSVITGDQRNGYIITNTHTPEIISVEGGKTWEDAENQDGKRPDSIVIRLYADGVEVASKTVNTADNWKWSFTDLPKYSGGKEITYTITEDLVEGYTTTVNGFDVTNTYEPEKVSIFVTKAWDDANDQDGIRPESITVTLLADGKDTGKTLTLSEENKWTGSFDDLDKYVPVGHEIQYTVAEAEVEGYTSNVTGDMTTGYIITNTHEPELIDINGTKIWDDANNQDGKRPESITIRLLANGVEVDSVTVTEADDWAWSFTDLPKYANGEVISYVLTEDDAGDYIPGFVCVDVEGGKEFTVTNKYTPEECSITVVKAWADDSNAEGKRPDSVTILLLANGEDTGKRLQLTADGNWTGTFYDLPKYADGELIEYTIDEEAVSGYKTVIRGSAENGFTVTNSYTTIPQTGDERTPVLWIGLMAASLFCFTCALVPAGKKRRR